MRQIDRLELNLMNRSINLGKILERGNKTSEPKTETSITNFVIIFWHVTRTGFFILLFNCNFYM